MSDSLEILYHLMSMISEWIIYFSSEYNSSTVSPKKINFKLNLINVDGGINVSSPNRIHEQG